MKGNIPTYNFKKNNPFELENILNRNGDVAFLNENEDICVVTLPLCYRVQNSSDR